MIPLELTLLVFFVLGVILKSRTYFILAVFAWINIYADKFTSSEDIYLMLTYASIDFSCALAIIYLGDIQKLYQTSMLAMMVLAHSFMELSLINDSVWIIESNLYINVIMVLLVMQMLGGIYGRDRISKTLLRHSHNPFATNSFGLFNHKAHHISGEDK